MFGTPDPNRTTLKVAAALFLDQQAEHYLVRFSTSEAAEFAEYLSYRQAQEAPLLEVIEQVNMAWHPWQCRHWWEIGKAGTRLAVFSWESHLPEHITTQFIGIGEKWGAIVQATEPFDSSMAGAMQFHWPDL